MKADVSGSVCFGFFERVNVTLKAVETLFDPVEPVFDPVKTVFNPVKPSIYEHKALLYISNSTHDAVEHDLLVR